MRDRYSIVVGLLFLALIVVATIQTLSGGGAEGTLGLDRQPPRWPLPEFAVPAAAGQLEGDANVAQDDCEVSALPCPGTPVAPPACRIDTPGALRVCDLFDRPLVISFWFTKGGDCADQQDVVDATYRRYRGRVNFLSLDVRDDRETVRELIRRHGWEMPVGYDRDGAVASLYRVGGCPTFAYVYPGGTLRAPASANSTPPSSPPGSSDLLGASRGSGAEMAAAPPSRCGWDPAPQPGPGWRLGSPPSFPASASPGSRSTASPRKSPEPVRRRLRDLSDRFYGAQAIRMRERPIPWAYRVFFRQIGLDPDRTRTPVERLAFERLRDGAFRSRGLPADALTIATVETGVALRAFDAERLDGGLCIRDSAPGESLAGRPGELAQGTLTIADETGPVGLLFGECRRGLRGRAPPAAASRSSPSRSTACRRSPSTEALWMAATTLAA